MRVALCGVAAACMASLAFGAVSASADTVTETFTDGSLKVFGSDDPVDVLGTTVTPAGDLTFDAAFTAGTTGPFTVSPATWDYEKSGISISGIAGSIDLLQGNPATGLMPFGTFTGDYNQATGVMTGDIDGYYAVVILGNFNAPPGAPCSIGPLSLDFTTEDDSLYLSDPFDAASSPAINGSMTAKWTTLPSAQPLSADPANAAACNTLNAFTNGPGGLWLGNGTSTAQLVAPPPATPIQPAPAPVQQKKKAKKKKCAKKKGKKGAIAKKKKCKKKKKK